MLTMIRTPAIFGGLAFLLTAVVVIVLAVVVLSNPASDDDRTLTLVYWQAPSMANPYLSGGFKDRDAGSITLEPLAKYDPDGV